MKKQIEILAREQQPGDVFVARSATNALLITVEREIDVEDNYAEGTALQIVDSQGDPLVLFKMRASAMAEIGARCDEEWLALYSDGSMGAVPFVYYAEEIEASKKTVEVPQPDRPKITRAHFIATLEATAADNDLDVGTDFLRAIVFAADRLGLY